jgi:hypothetical protein
MAKTLTHFTPPVVDVTVVDVIMAAIAAFNVGDEQALRTRVLNEPYPQRGGPTPQALHDCRRGRPRDAVRPMPLTAGEDYVSVTAIHELDHRRVVCELEAADGTRVVGIYSVDAGQITAACHYFSTIAMLVKIGTLQSPVLDAIPERHRPAPKPAGRWL